MEYFVIIFLVLLIINLPKIFGYIIKEHRFTEDRIYLWRNSRKRKFLLLFNRNQKSPFFVQQNITV